MKKTIIITILAATVIGIILLLDWPAYQRMNFLKTEVEKHHQFLKEKQELSIKVNQLKQSYEAQEENIKKLNYALPEGKDIPNLIVQLEALASENGLILEEINFGSKQAGKTESEKAYKSMGTTLSLTGSYTGFKSFLGALENNIRIMDIGLVDFSTAAMSKELPEGGEQFFTFDLELQVYYQ